MTFLAMIIALAMLQVWAGKNPLQQDRWFLEFQSRVRKFGFSPCVVLGIYIVIPVIAAALIFDVLESLLFGLLWIAAAVAILLFSFGRADYATLVSRYRNYCKNGDFESAYLFAQDELGLDMEQEDVTEVEAVHAAIQRKLLYAGYERWFPVLFYFVVIGPVGALAYRLLQLGKDSTEREQAERLLYFADWLPSRLLAAGFALTGDFLGCREEFSSSLSTPESAADEVLLSVACAATGAPIVTESAGESTFSELAAGQVEAIEALLSRSAGAWVLVISLLVLIF